MKKNKSFYLLIIGILVGIFAFSGCTNHNNSDAKNIQQDTKDPTPEKFSVVESQEPTLTEVDWSNYFEGLTAEQWIEKRQLWVKKYERNEPLDCRIYARAASVVMGLDRMSSSANITKTATKEAKKPKKSEDDPWGSSDFTHYWD